MSTAHKELILRFYEAVSGRKKTVDLLSRYVSDERLISHILAFEAAFPRYRITLDEAVAEGERVAVKATIEGEHGGTFAGLEATGKPIAFRALILYSVRDGRIADHWLSPEPLELLRQLGATIELPT